MSWQFIKVHLNQHFSSLYFYLLAGVLFIQNYSYGLKHIQLPISDQLLQAGVTDPSLEWSLWSASYSFGLVLLVWGLFIFTQVEKPRKNGLVRLLYTKPLHFVVQAKSQLVALSITGTILTLVGLYGSNILLLLTTSYRPSIGFFLLPPLIGTVSGTISFTFGIYLLSLLIQDWRVFFPIQFLIFFLTSILSIDIIADYRKLTLFANPLLDPYLIQSRIFLLLGCVGVYYLIRKTIHDQTLGKDPWWVIVKKQSTYKRSPKRLGFAPIARLYYTMKIYYGWRIIMACICGIVLSGAYIWRMHVGGIDGMSTFEISKLITMFAQVLLSLLGLLTTLQLGNFEERYQMFPLIHSLPQGGIYTFRDKLIAMCTYFFLIVISFSIPFLFIGQIFLWKSYALALFPPFLFFIGIGYLTILLTSKSSLGYLVSGGLWFFFLAMERKIPYWIQPFFEVAEYRFYRPLPYLVNKSVIMGTVCIFFGLIILFEYYRINGSNQEMIIRREHR